MIYDFDSFGVILVQYIYIWYSFEHSSSILLLILFPTFSPGRTSFKDRTWAEEELQTDPDVVSS
jgi:hypothetical protein